VETIILVMLVVLVTLLMLSRSRTVRGLIVNGLIGVVLLFLTNRFLEDDIPINLIAILVCAVGGVFGWLTIVAVHLLGIAF
jgi:multisubunit Na+/H+ antiporter MnhE subunit